MAIRYIEKSKTWQVYWRDSTTKKQVSRNFKRKEDAEKENSLILGKGLGSSDSQERKTLEMVYEEYLEEKNLSPKRLNDFNWNMKYPLKYLGTKDIKEITPKDIDNVRFILINDPNITESSVNHNLRHFRVIMYYAVSRYYREPFKFPKIPKYTRKLIVPPNRTELKLLYENALPHIQRVIILGAYLGVRIGECELFQLIWSDVNFDDSLLRVHGSRKNLNALWRDVPIQEALLPLFKKWYEEDNQDLNMFIINYNGCPVKSIKTAWNRTLAKANIKRTIRPYDLRHAFGTELVAAGVDIGTVAKLMGHSSPTMLLNHYQYVMDIQKREAVTKIKPI